MIVNQYAVLDALVALLRLPLGIVLMVLGMAAYRQIRRAVTPEERATLENRCYLLLTLAVVVQWFNILSWPLFYLLLQSYVEEWPGIMCVWGVTQIGTGSSGPSRFLPALLTGLEAFKPALVFVSGAWFALYQLHRQSRTGPLLSRVVLLLVALGLLAAVDAAAELTYLAIPKKEVFPSAGCCTEALASARRLLGPLPQFGAQGQAVLAGAYGVVHAALALLLISQWRWPARARGARLVGAAVLACLALPISAWFLSDVAAPRILHQPNHACPYDLLPRAPGAVIAVALHFLGCFAVGWGNLVYWLGNHAEVTGAAAGMVERWLRLALGGYVASALVISVQLLLA